MGKLEKFRAIMPQGSHKENRKHPKRVLTHAAEFGESPRLA